MPMRCITSGRLTPAASTRISTSPAAGSGTGRSTGSSISGPPGRSGSIAIIVFGMVVIRSRSPLNASGARPCRLTDGVPKEDSAAMDLEELFPSKPGDPLVLLVKQDLDPLSVEELEERIATLEGEIARVRAKIEAAVNHRASAEDLFKK